ILAVRYQILVQFMLTGATAIASLIVVLMGYRRYFTEQAQLAMRDETMHNHNFERKSNLE
ncbi:MAG: ABC transporter permease, partial [Desulfitobacteriaceae bacterium]